MSTIRRVGGSRGQEVHHLSQMRAGSFPMAHVALTKQDNDNITVRWPVANTGNAEGRAFLHVLTAPGDPTPMSHLQIPDVLIPAGSAGTTVETVVSLFAGRLGPGLHNMIVRINRSNPTGSTVMDTHTFTVNMVTSGPTGPNLQPNTDPSQPQIF